MTIIVWDRNHLFADSAMFIDDAPKCQSMEKIKKADFRITHVDGSRSDEPEHTDRIVAFAATGTQSDADTLIDRLIILGSVNEVGAECTVARRYGALMEARLILIGQTHNYIIDPRRLEMSFEKYQKSEPLALGYDDAYWEMKDQYPNKSPIQLMRLLFATTRACYGDIEVWGYPTAFQQEYGAPNEFRRIGIACHDGVSLDDHHARGLSDDPHWSTPDLILNPFSFL